MIVKKLLFPCLMASVLISSFHSFAMEDFETMKPVLNPRRTGCCYLGKTVHSEENNGWSMGEKVAIVGIATVLLGGGAVAGGLYSADFFSGNSNNSTDLTTRGTFTSHRAITTAMASMSRKEDEMARSFTLYSAGFSSGNSNNSTDLTTRGTFTSHRAMTTAVASISRKEDEMARSFASRYPQFFNNGTNVLVSDLWNRFFESFVTTHKLNANFDNRIRSRVLKEIFFSKKIEAIVGKNATVMDHKRPDKNRLYLENQEEHLSCISFYFGEGTVYLDRSWILKAACDKMKYQNSTDPSDQVKFLMDHFLSANDSDIQQYVKSLSQNTTKSSQRKRNARDQKQADLAREKSWIGAASGVWQTIKDSVNWVNNLGVR